MPSDQHRTRGHLEVRWTNGDEIAFMVSEVGSGNLEVTTRAAIEHAMDVLQAGSSDVARIGKTWLDPGDLSQLLAELNGACRTCIDVEGTCWNCRQKATFELQLDEGRGA